MLLSPSQSHAFLSNPRRRPQRLGQPSPERGPDRSHLSHLEKERDSQSGQMFFNRSTDRGQSWQQEALGLDREKPAGSRSSSPRLDSDGKGTSMPPGGRSIAMGRRTSS